MSLSNPVSALTKLVSEDSLNGMPVRRADDQGTVIPAKTRSVVVASAAYTTNGTSAAQSPSPLYREALFLLRVTAAAGTTPTLNVYIDLSDDGGATWYQGPQLGPANIAAVPASPYAGYTLTMHPANSNGSWGDTYRIRWVIAGTSPSFTFQVTAIHK